jgi:nucleoid DNA-binding protein
MNISVHIADLLLKNDCIVLEGFGGFILQKNNAILTDLNSFKPPSKTISFNQFLKSNDGILLNHLITLESINQEEAKAHIQNYISTLKSTLEKEGLVVLDSIGKFYYDKQKKLQFTPEQNKNFDTKAFGLETVSFNPIEREEKINKTIVTDLAPEIKLEKSKKKKKRNIKFAPFIKVAALLVLTSGIIYQFMDQELVLADFNEENIAAIETEDVLESIKSLVPSFDFSSEEIKTEEVKKTIYKKAPIAKKEELAPVIKENITVKKKSIKVYKKTVSKKNQQETINIKASQNQAKKVSKTRKPIFLNESNFDKIFVIVGSFGAEKNAAKMVKKLAKDKITAKVIPAANGMFRVGVYGFNSYEDATDIWLIVKKTHAPSAWVLGQDEV